MQIINTINVRDGLAHRFHSRPPSAEALSELGLD
jgi:hypothetical protein